MQKTECKYWGRPLGQILAEEGEAWFDENCNGCECIEECEVAVPEKLRRFEFAHEWILHEVSNALVGLWNAPHVEYESGDNYFSKLEDEALGYARNVIEKYHLKEESDG